MMALVKGVVALQYIFLGLAGVWAQEQSTGAATGAVGVSSIGSAASASASASGSGTASGATCASTIAPQNAAPSVASGWKAEVVASGLTAPRGIKFDPEGGLLVVEQDRGVSRLTFTSESGSCIRATGNATLIIDDPTLNHGLEISEDGGTLYASSPFSVYAWDYDASSGRNTSGPTEVVNNFGPDEDHVSRTLLLSRREPGMILVSRGSLSNLDLSTLDVTTGISQIKAFNLTNQTDTAYSYPEEGLRLGWGLRNSVGVAEHPVSGGIYSVENSVDNFNRSGQNIHQNNPGEEMNFHGYLNGTAADVQGQNYGYPTCFAVWNSSEATLENSTVGTQVAIGDQNATVSDTICRDDTVPPRLTFQAHQAPLDIKFNTNGTAAWVTFHGSWNRDEPIGYKLSVIAFNADGAPVEPSNSTTAAVDVVSNADVSRCPDECFRPVGIAWDSQGRLYFSSDQTGEIYVVTREDGSPADEANSTSGLPSSSTGAAPGASAAPSAASGVGVDGARFVAVGAGVMALFFLL